MKSVHNFGKIVRFILRRDRLYLPLWTMGIVFLAIFFVPMFPEFFGDEQSRAILTEMMKNPAMIAMIGISYGDGPGAMYALFMLVWAALGAGIFNILFVVRHTRKDEEEGRSEMLAALPLGRSANLLAVLLVALLADLAITALTAMLIPAFGVEGLDVSGALVFSAALGATGFVFAAITALMAQVFSTSKSTLISAFVLLGISYLLRAAGDMSSSFELASLISPLGLAERCQAWIENLYWPILVLAAEAVCFFVAAFVILSVRDTGAGLFTERHGRSYAPALLRGELGLAWRLTRSICIGWVVVMLILGASYGSIFNDMSSFMESNVVYATIIGGDSGAEKDMMESFISFLLMLMAIVAAIPVCMVVLKLKAEERRGRLEQVVAKRVSRVRLMASYLLIALVLGVALQVCTPLGMYASAAAMMDAPPALDTMILASLNYLPAVAALAGLAALLVGLLPRLTSITWLFITYCFLMSYMGNMMLSSAANQGMRDAFDVLLKISPFGLLPAWPAEEVNGVLMVGMIAATGLLVVVGAALYRRRDLAG